MKIYALCSILATHSVVVHSWSTSISSQRQHRSFTHLSATSTKFESNERISRDDSGDSKTEEKRLKFMLNQLKGNLVEADLRAAAAERRVAMLQKTLKDLKKSSQVESIDTEGINDDGKDKVHDKTVIEQLSAKIKELTESLQFIQSEADKKLQLEKEIQDKSRMELETKYNVTLVELEKTEGELADAKFDIVNLTTAIEDMKKEYEDKVLDILSKSKIELDTTKATLEEQLNSAKANAKEEKDTLLNQIIELKGSLVKNEVKVVDLEIELAKTIKDLNNEISSTKAAAKKELDATLAVLLRTKKDAEEKAVTIENLENERASIRKLMRLQAGLVKRRVGKLFQKKGKN